MENLPVGDMVFWAFAALTVGGACVVAFSGKITHAAFALMFALFGVACLYVFLGADFLAAVQVMVYVGGILVLLLFGILMTQTVATVNLRRGGRNVLLGGLVAVVLALVTTVVTLQTRWPEQAVGDPLPTTEHIGNLLMTDFVLPFEVASILLLAAMIGAVKMARKDHA